MQAETEIMYALIITACWYW